MGQRKGLKAAKGIRSKVRSSRPRWLLSDGKVLLAGVVMHDEWQGHADEVVSLIMMEGYPHRFRAPGEVPNGFLLSKQFEVIVRQTDEEVDAFIAERREAGEYYISIGTGRDPRWAYNDHGSEKPTSATAIIARHLQISRTAWASELIKTVTHSDNNADTRLTEMSRVIKDMAYNGVGMERIKAFVMEVVEAQVTKANLVSFVRQEFDEERDLHVVNGVKVIMLEMDNPYCYRFASQRGADILVKMSNDGESVQIMFMHGSASKRWSQEIAMEICERIGLQKKMSRDQIDANKEDVRRLIAIDKAEDMPGATEIVHLHKQSIYIGGTRTHKKKACPFTRYTLEDILEVALERVPARGDSSGHIKEVEMRVRKLRQALPTPEQAVDGMEAATIAAIPELERQLKHLASAIAKLKKSVTGKVSAAEAELIAAPISEADQAELDAMKANENPVEEVEYDDEDEDLDAEEEEEEEEEEETVVETEDVAKVN